jgi:diguanylate cyclase (GGDEF)-like protein
VSHFLEPATGAFVEDAFRHLLRRETARATRYQDFFSVCLLKPDTSGSQGDDEPSTRQALTRKIAEFIRSTDLVGEIDGEIGIVLLHTEGADAIRVAERLRSQIEQVTFPSADGGGARRVTLSVGGVSFPRDGYNDTVLLSRAQAHLSEASRRGGNQVVCASDPRP